MSYLTKEDLNSFVGKKMYVVCANEDVLRKQDCACWIAEDEDAAQQFFSSTNGSRTANSIIHTQIIDIDDISAFSLLFDKNYLGFNIIGHGFVYWWQLVERKPDTVAKLSRMLKTSRTLLVSIDANGEYVTERFGTSHIVRSFYLSQKLAEQHGTPVAVDLSEILDEKQKPTDVSLLTLNGTPIYGCDLYDAVCRSRSTDDAGLLTKERLGQLAKHIKARYNVPKWDITVEPVEKDDIFISKIGGYPYWPVGMEYPVDANGRPLFLLAQIVMGSQTEMLQFFIADDGIYGCNFENLTDSSNFRVVYHERIDNSVTLESVRKRNIPSSDDAEEESLPVSEVGKITLKKGADHLSASSSRYTGIVCAEASLLFGIKIPKQACKQIEESLEDELSTEGSKLYGLPFFLRDDPRDDKGNYNGKNYGILLLQLDSSECFNLMFGDFGVCNFFINKDDLEKRDFSDVLYYWD